jgi:PhnB protein
MQKYDYVRKGFSAITPALAVRNAGAAMTWYKKIFGAQEIMCLKDNDETIVHAELKFADAVIMLAEENPAYNRSPQTLNGTAVILNFYVPDADIVVTQAVQEGAKIIFPVKDQFYGDRSGRIQDPFGHQWIISAIKENVSVEEMNARFEQSSRDDK